MSDWNPNLYLEFDRERTQPSIDLTMKIPLAQPQRIIDIGCGPGNSTNVLQTRWPQAEIIGLDSSQAMIAKAKSKYPALDWLCADAAGDLTGLGGFDLVFSNAAIQWMPDHERLLPNLFALLNTGGVLAIQVPDVALMPVYNELVRLATSDKWQGRFAGFNIDGSRFTHNASFYYDIICKLSDAVALWETRYFHVMNTHADIVRWYSGTGLKPYLDYLPDDAPRAEFQTDFENVLRHSYPVQTDGKVLFPFTRIFFTVKKS